MIFSSLFEKVKINFSFLELDIISITEFVFSISWSFIFIKISPSFIQLFSAILHSTGDKIIQGFFIISPESIACFKVGIVFNPRLVSIFVFIQIGFIQIKKSIKNIKKAKIKFIKTQASIIIACSQLFLFAKL